MLQSFSRGTCKSFYPTLASEKVLCCWLKRFLFFKSRCFFILTDVIKSYCEKQFWKLLHLLTIDTQNINQIIVKIGFCSAAKIASTIKLIENDKRGSGFILCRHRGLSRLQSMPLSSNIYRCIKWIWLVSTGFASNIKVSQDLGVKTFQISRPHVVWGVQNFSTDPNIRDLTICIWWNLA